MSDAQSETKPQFELPDELTDENITDTRRDLLQALNDHPRQPGQWYSAKIGVNEQYLNIFRHKIGGIVEKVQVGSREGGGAKYVYELTDEARRALIRDGVIEADGVDEIEAMSEEPSQRAEPGTMTITGALDLTEGSEGFQTWQDRPRKENGNGGMSNGDDQSAEEEAEDHDEDEGTVSVDLDHETVFLLLHTADEEAARRFWDALRS